MSCNLILSSGHGDTRTGLVDLVEDDPVAMDLMVFHGAFGLAGGGRGIQKAPESLPRPCGRPRSPHNGGSHIVF